MGLFWRLTNVREISYKYHPMICKKSPCEYEELGCRTNYHFGTATMMVVIHK